MIIEETNDPTVTETDEPEEPAQPDEDEEEDAA